MTAESTRLAIPQIVAELTANLGTTLVAYMADVRSRQLPARWISGDVDPRDPTKQRLMLAHQVFATIAAKESADVARQWLIGANPRFGGETPASRIRSFAAADVYGAMRAFIEDTGGD